MSKRRQSFAGDKGPLTNDAKMQFLLQDVCEKLGFCGGARQATLDDFIAKSPVNKETFSNFVLECEGMEPWEHSEHRAVLQEHFEKVFETEFVSNGVEVGG